MELKYCDRCGTAVKVEAGNPDPMGEFVCDGCQDKQADKRSSSGSKLQIG